MKKWSRLQPEPQCDFHLHEGEKMGGEKERKELGHYLQEKPGDSSTSNGAWDGSERKLITYF